ncbi:MAG: hypothetical protein OHK0039_40440 [Bacteroidia bacterium]
MKYVLYSLCIAALLAAGCGDRLAPEPGIVPPQVALHRDAANLTAPSLNAGTYEAAVRFSAADLDTLIGRQLVGVYFYFREVPDETTVKIYRGTRGDSPDVLVYTGTASAAAESWNYHSLATPVALQGDLWIAVGIGHSDRRRVVGCDPGPAVTDGDWLYDEIDGLWRTLRTRAPGVDINWNIRGVVE